MVIRRMTPQQFSHALGITESRGDPKAWGDDTHGTRHALAMGRWQVHPAWVWDHTDNPEAKPAELESWDAWIERLVEIFAARWLPLIPPVEIAMWFHLGHRVEQNETGWDSEYAQRFIAASI